MAIAEHQKAQPTQMCCYKLAMAYIIVYPADKENRAANHFNPHLHPISDGDAAG